MHNQPEISASPVDADECLYLDAAASAEEDPADELHGVALYEYLLENSKLTRREQQVIIMRLGLYGQEPLSRTEVAKRMNTTPERIRLTERKFTRVSGLLPRRRRLRDYID